MPAGLRGLNNRDKEHQGILREMEIELCPHLEVGNQGAHTIVLNHILQHHHVPALLEQSPGPIAPFKLRRGESGYRPVEGRHV